MLKPILLNTVSIFESDRGPTLLMKEIAESIGKNVARLRRSKGLSQQQLADELKMTQSAVARIERGHVYPRESTVEIIAAYFKCEPEALTKGLHTDSASPDTQASAPTYYEAVKAIGAMEKELQIANHRLDKLDEEYAPDMTGEMILDKLRKAPQKHRGITLAVLYENSDLAPKSNNKEADKMFEMAIKAMKGL